MACDGEPTLSVNQSFFSTDMSSLVTIAGSARLRAGRRSGTDVEYHSLGQRGQRGTLSSGWYSQLR